MPVLEHSAPIVILTGAGISSESGLHTFRDADGVWASVRIEDVATPKAFERDPERVQQFYNARRRALLDPRIVPNAAHRALVQLEHAWPGGVLVVTQNVDDLHERAGSRRLLHMHGELLKVRCRACDAVHVWRVELSTAACCATCGRAGALRPHVVWFGEMPLHMPEIEAALQACGLFASIGTSGNVYPAAGFVALAREGGAHTVELNLEPSQGASLFAERVYGSASTVVPAFVERLLAL